MINTKRTAIFIAILATSFYLGSILTSPKPVFACDSGKGETAADCCGQYRCLGQEASCNCGGSSGGSSGGSTGGTSGGCKGASNCSTTCGDGTHFSDSCPASGAFGSCGQWASQACSGHGGGTPAPTSKTTSAPTAAATAAPTQASSNNVPAGQKCESWCGSCGYTFIACGSYCPSASQCGQSGQTDLRQTNGGSPNENQTTNSDPIVNGVHVAQPGQIAGGTPTPTPAPTNTGSNGGSSGGTCKSGATYCVGKSFGTSLEYQTGKLCWCNDTGNGNCACQTGGPATGTGTGGTFDYKTSAGPIAVPTLSGCPSKGMCEKYEGPGTCEQVPQSSPACYQPKGTYGGATDTVQAIKVYMQCCGDSGGHAKQITETYDKNGSLINRSVSACGFTFPNQCTNKAGTLTDGIVTDGNKSTPDLTNKVAGNGTENNDYPPTSANQSTDCLSQTVCQGKYPGKTCALKAGSSYCYTTVEASNTTNVCIGGDCDQKSPYDSCGQNKVCKTYGSKTGGDGKVGYNCSCIASNWVPDSNSCTVADSDCTGKNVDDGCGGTTLGIGAYTSKCTRTGVNPQGGSYCSCKSKDGWEAAVTTCTSGEGACLGQNLANTTDCGNGRVCKSTGSSASGGQSCACRDKNWVDAGCLTTKTKCQQLNPGENCMADAVGCYVPANNSCEANGGSCSDLESKQCNDGGQIWNGGNGCSDGLSCCKANSKTTTSYTNSSCGTGSSSSCGDKSIGSTCNNTGKCTSTGTNTNGSNRCICSSSTTGTGTGTTTPTGSCGGDGQSCCDPFSQNGKICNNGLYCNTTTGKCQNTPPTNLCQGGGSGGTPSTKCAVFKCGDKCNNGNQCTINRQEVDCSQADAVLSSQCGQIDFLDTNGAYCGVKNQHCGGSCTGTSNPTGTPNNPTGTNPPSNPVPVCVEVNLYYKSGDNWVKTAMADIANHVHVGDEIRFSVLGKSGSFSKAHFRVKVGTGAWGDWMETTGKLANSAGTEFYTTYTVPAGTINVEAELF